VMRPLVPEIPRPQKYGGDLGLVDSLTSIPRGNYADVIVQFVSSTKSDHNGMPCLLVWDGSDWPLDRPLNSLDSEDKEPEIPANPVVKEKAKGRIVTIFCYDYDNQLQHPIRSGDWLYVQNVHCGFTQGSKYSSFIMHNNARPRSIWRLDLPIAEGLFYEEQWKAAIERVKSAQPVSPEVIKLRQQLMWDDPGGGATLAAAVPEKWTPEGLEQLRQLIADEMEGEGIVLSDDDEALAAIAKSATAAMKAKMDELDAAAASAADQRVQPAPAAPLPSLQPLQQSAAARSPPAAAAVPRRQPRQQLATGSDSLLSEEEC
ncbi:hypothetical protein PMAYCL1PPCAC_14475, partial [Pristionchus mayeri]